MVVNSVQYKIHRYNYIICGTIFVSVFGLCPSSNMQINLKISAATQASELISMMKVSNNMNNTSPIHLHL